MQSKMKFVTIGYIEWRKGQDLLIDAVYQLPNELLDQAEFILIGQNTSLMAQDLMEKIQPFSNIRVLGTVSREELHKLLENSDMLICPSREDPMPTVCAEAMMHKVPCLVSDATGTASYIKNEYDGLIFKSEDTESLRERIIWCINNQGMLRDMGEKAFDIYQRVFSMEAFENNLLKYVQEMI